MEKATLSDKQPVPSVPMLCISARALLLFLCLGATAQAGDWPMWRYDASHTAASPERLGDNLTLHWTRQLAPVEPSWPKQPRLCFDAGYEPIVMDDFIYVPSMVSDSVTAFDTQTGAEIWRFYADGPVRFAPVGSKGRIYFVSDDGFLYCVGAATGTLIWRKRGLPDDRQDRKVLGNGRLTSLWPARGGPVLVDDTIYFAAGIWADEGIYIYALDAKTGKILWLNSDTGRIEELVKDHGGIQYGGFAPQGYLTVIGQHLIVPNGSAMPGILDRSTGKRLPMPAYWGGRGGLEKGTWFTAGINNLLFVGGDLYDLTTLLNNRSDHQRSRLLIAPSNLKALGPHRKAILTSDRIYASTPTIDVPIFPALGKPAYRVAPSTDVERLEAWHLPKATDRFPETPKRSASIRQSQSDATQQANEAHLMQGQHPLSSPEWKKEPFNLLTSAWVKKANLAIHLKSGSRLYASAPGKIVALDISQENTIPEIVWEHPIVGTISGMLAATGKLYAVTREGTIHAFGPPRPQAAVIHGASTMVEAPVVVNHITAAAANQDGYCVIFGASSMPVAESILRRSRMRIILVDSDENAIARIRQSLDSRGIPRSRFHAYQHEEIAADLPPYIANFVVGDASYATRVAASPVSLGKLARIIHPYGGQVWLHASVPTQLLLRNALALGANPQNLALTRVGEYARFDRPTGPLGAGEWTHLNGDRASTRVSPDTAVRGELGILWFGGGINSLLPEWDFTHSRPIPPLVCQGRILMQTPPSLHAIDAYTGLPLWKKTFADPFELESKAERRWYRPRSFIYATVKNRIYVITQPATISQQTIVNPSKPGNTCLVIDAKTGDTLRNIGSPFGDSWRDLKVTDNRIILSSTKAVVAVDPKTGATIWTKEAAAEVVDVVVSESLVYFLDAPLPNLKRRRRGQARSDIRAYLVALAETDGAEIWRAKIDLPPAHSGAILAYSRENRSLITIAGQLMICYRSTGERAWQVRLSRKEVPNVIDRGAAESGRTRPLLYPEHILFGNGKQFDWTNGRLQRSTSSIPQKPRGCSQILGSTYYLTGRDGHAITVNRETGSLQSVTGVRTGCTNSLIPACGIITAPYFAQGCSCNYALPTSFGLVPTSLLASPSN